MSGIGGGVSGTGSIGGSIRNLSEKSAFGSGSELSLSTSSTTFPLESNELLHPIAAVTAADNDMLLEQQEQQKLLQTTQSLYMASTLLENAMPDAIYQQFVAPSLGVSTNENNNKHFIKIDVERLLRENHLLRLRLKEVTYDRDRLLCEISNGRLEMNMIDFKQLPDNSFPPKAIDRRGSTQCDISAASIDGSGSLHSSLPLADGSENYVYLPAPCVPTSMYANAAAPTLTDGSQTDIVFHHPHLQYSTCHQQKVLSHQPLNLSAGGAHYSQHLNSCQHHHYRHHHVNNVSGVAAAGASANASAVVVTAGRMSPSSLQQNFQKKNNMRNPGDVLKRPRAQTAYELSQDLLEKQIELLERKYGGVRARNAAIIIQRAFRHYMMVKKFASITAMAKQEKRLSRRMLVSSNETGPTSTSSMSSAYGSATESQIDMAQQHHQQQQLQPRITIMAGPPGSAASTAAGVASVSTYQTLVSRAPPTRSLSMRERRQGDGSPMPRSQSGSSTTSISSTPCSLSSLGQTHPHVNLLHAAETHVFGGVAHPSQTAQHYYGSYHVVPHESSYSNFSNSSQYEHPLNATWVSASGCSPHTPYYSAAQIYMRPKGATTPADRKKVPPEVPKRTSSISAQQHAHLAAYQQHHQMIILRQTPTPPSTLQRTNGLCKTNENGSLTSVQSSGSDSSITSAERIAHSDISSDRSNSPNTWKRGTNLNSSQQFSQHSDPAFVALQGMPSAIIAVGSTSGANDGATAGAGGVSAAAAAIADDHTMSSHTTAAQYEQQDQQLHIATSSQNYKVSETLRKRQYRVGLNLFNKKPEKGITYLIRRGFLENTPQGVARFLIARKGLSRKMIGEYLGNLQNQFNMAVLNCFALELDLSDMQVDVALRKFQAYFRMPGEAQKIERLMEVFSQRFCQCNPAIVGRLRSSDTIFVLAFAIIMLNTDLHSPNLKPERRMRVEDFIKNLRGIDDCHDIDREMLAGIYERLKANEFKPGSDHVTQVMKVQATIVGKKPNLALPHRRLVCYCRLYEIPDVNKKERPGVHQREVFLFNDLLVITKIFSKKKSSVTYTFRNSFPLCGMVVTLLNVTNYQYCIQLSQKVDGKILITFNARNEHDRCKFAEDLKESISEMDEMESLRIEAELERQKSARNRVTGSTENRDSGVADVEVCPCPMQAKPAGETAQYAADAAQQLKRSALSNSLLDMHEQFGNDKPQRRGSVGSLDSGMSISFQSTTATTASRENPALIAAAANIAASKMRYNLQTAVNNSAEGVFLPSGIAGYSTVNNYSAHQQQAHNSALMHQHQHLQQSAGQQICPAQGFAPTHSQAGHAAMGHMMTEGCEHKHSRSDDNGRATEV